MSDMAHLDRDAAWVPLAYTCPIDLCTREPNQHYNCETPHVSPRLHTQSAIFVRGWRYHTLLSDELTHDVPRPAAAACPASSMGVK